MRPAPASSPDTTPLNPRQSFINAILQPRFEHRILGLMLIALHLAIWFDFGGALSRCLMLAHLGLFLLWQPVWSREQQLKAMSGILFVTVTLVFVTWLSWPLMSVWLVLLTGMVGGRVTSGRSDRYAYLASLVFLVCELLLGCIPATFDIAPLQREARLLLTYGLIAVPAALLVMPGRRTPGRSPHSVDFLYGLTTSLLVCVLALGSLLAMGLGKTDYPTAVTQTILGIALFLLTISWLWAPLAGFSGLGSIWERHLQNIGTAFEPWLSELDHLSREHSRAHDFLDAATERLVALPWVAGADWEAPDGHGSAGTRTANLLSARIQDMRIRLYAHRKLGGVLYLHAKLLLQVIGHFHNAKQRQEESSEHAHMRAIHETGARVTHDIKNLLQSLQGISVAVQQDNGRDPAAVQALIERQLPHITQRLQMALDKLQAPTKAQATDGDAERWWDVLRMRNRGQNFQFDSELANAARIPVDLFDSVTENLLENARIKRQLDAGVTIGVTLKVSGDEVSLSVHDSGPPIRPAVAQRLFRAPVKSRNGLGIGLYQAARQAQQVGFELRLAENDEEGVRFELRRTS